MRLRARWRGAVLPLLIGSAVAVAVACSFPDVQFADAADSGDDVLDQDAPDEAAPDVDSSLPSDVDPEGGSKEAGSAPDGGGRIEAGPDGDCPGAADQCDCDGDHVRRAAPGCTPAGTSDCDDLNLSIYPGQGYIDSPWPDGEPHGPPGDWNCDGNTTKRLNYNVTCATLGGDCSQGFAGDPPCGGSDIYNYCKPLLSPLNVPIGCTVDHHDESGVNKQSCE